MVGQQAKPVLPVGAGSAASPSLVRLSVLSGPQFLHPPNGMTAMLLAGGGAVAKLLCVKAHQRAKFRLAAAAGSMSVT